MKYRSMKPSSQSARAGALPERWDLTHLLKQPSDDFDAMAKHLESLVSQFESWRERLSHDMPGQTFPEILRLAEQIAAVSTKLSAYAYLWFSEDTTNLQARAFKAKVEERLTSLQNRILFFDLWWQAVDEANATRLLGVSGDFRYHLDTIRRFKNYTLSEPEEKIINLKTITGRSAINTLYDVLTNGFTFKLTVNGKSKTLTREQLSAYLRSPKARLREAAYKELYRVFAANHDLLGEIYTALVKDWKAENVELRKFPSPIAARNLGNDIPDEAVDALLTVCAKNARVFQEYFRLKARICKIKPMNRYHLYAPHPADRTQYRYPDAIRMVLAAYRTFSPKLADLAERVFQERHIDARTRPGKLSGAYCYSVLPGFTPYVLLNYTGEARDVATLAHELGHAVHGMMAADHTAFTFHATLPLAETASVFGERILSDALMAQETNKGVKQGLLLAQLDDIYATVLRQAYFVLFEKQAHGMIAGGATVKDLGEAYLANLRQQFGKTVRVPDVFRWEWLTIPHIFGSPFYCYSYSFGNLLVLALYHMYKQQGAAFVPQYLALLAAGGSQSPASLLAQMGVDMRSETFWQSGFDTIHGMVEELGRTTA
ncbi:MAG: oligoendopeptidase F [Nitrospirae bacterium]|nr:MAG: oligoendopeptidase F [Nitrospirota bacterium]